MERKYILTNARMWSLLLLLLGCISMKAKSVNNTTKVIDQIVFGSTSSEKAHAFMGTNTEIISGGLDEKARRMLPGGPHLWEGGSMEFKMKVNPLQQNYVTVKLWGGDKGEELGRLIMYIDGKQMGYNNEGDYDVLSQTDNDALAPGRFVYVTMPLPPMLTQGKKQVDLKIKAFGRKWCYGGTWDKFQHELKSASRGVYRAYTHTESCFTPDAGERQGAMPAKKYRKDNSAEVVAKQKEHVIKYLQSMLDNAKTTKPAGTLKAINGNLELFAECYNVEWTPTYHNPIVVDLIVLNGDHIAQEWAYDHRYIEEEWGAVGYQGRAVAATWKDIETRLSDTIVVGRETMTRRQAWGRALKASVDYWRMHRRSYTNQSMLVDLAIYCANMGLALVEPDKALPEAKTRDFLYQSVGLRPWLGSDMGGEATGQRDVPMQNVHAPYGDNYYLVTKKGSGRELGWVATYGETDLSFIRTMIDLTNDDNLRRQLAKMQEARMPFRYPGYDGDGYACMKLCSEVDNRTAHFPLDGSAYSQPNIGEAWWMEVPALLPDNAVAVGAAQQSIAEGQYSWYISHRSANSPTAIVGMMHNVDEYAKVITLPKSNYRMPMMEGEPDFVYADEENAIVAIKHGDEIMYVNLYYRAERAVNRVARVYNISPSFTRLATIRTEVEVEESGYTSVRNDWTASTRGNQPVAPDSPVHQAWYGDVMPIAKRPAGALQPEYGNWGPFLGKASFYKAEYNGYVIGMNTTEGNAYNLKVKNGTYYDMVSKRNIKVNDGNLVVAPLSTMVLIAIR